MDKIEGPGQVFFFGDQGSNVKDMIGITARCHLYLAPPKCLDNLNLSDGPLGFAPQVLFQGQRFVSSDWLTGTFPETRKDVKKINTAGKLPKDARGPYICWPAPGEEADFSGIKARLLKEYGTFEGAKFVIMKWGVREPSDVPDGDGVSGDPIERT